MSAPAAGGRVLIASNRGPLSFIAGPGGRLSARRGGGGLVSGLLSVAAERDVLWVCAALSDADRAAAKNVFAVMGGPAQAKEFADLSTRATQHVLETMQSAAARLMRSDF
jgi:trehalose-6-phosphate synthase